MTVQDQPAPVPNDRPAVWDLVIADVERLGDPEAVKLVPDMRERDRLGRERYGTRLQPFNGRDALADAPQEALDLVAYIRQAHAEEVADSASLGYAFGFAMSAASLVKRLIDNRAALRAKGAT